MPMNFLLLFLLALNAPANPCVDYDILDKQIRDGAIAKAEAARRFSELIPQLDRHAAGSCPPRRADGEPSWVFPVDRARLRDIGGRSGSGYQPGGYNFFDGNRHHGHPAHDIFIHDENQDERDDTSGKPVPVRSVLPGIVIALESNWEAVSPLRGGRYVVVYHPASSELFCYAHLARISVRVGQCVDRGGVLGEVGRSGKSAARKRSPTHLHLTRLRIINGRPVPEDAYPELVRAIRRK